MKKKCKWYNVQFYTLIIKFIKNKKIIKLPMILKETQYNVYLSNQTKTNIL